VLIGSVTYPDLATRTSGDPLDGQAFHVAVDDTVTAGRIMRFAVDFTASDGSFSRDTLSVPLGTGTIKFQDFASGGVGLWTAGTWNVVTNDPEHTSRYFTDSPGGSYAPNADNSMRQNSTMNLSAGVHAYALFEARWELETNYDAASIDASPNGTAWTRLASTGTVKGTGYSFPQPANLPVFSGARWGWRPERADLSNFTGTGQTAVRVRFRLAADGFTQYDGFAFDSLRIVLYDPANQPAMVSVGDLPAAAALELAPPSPNPARRFARFAFTLPTAAPVRLEILDIQGRRLRELADRGAVSPGRYVREWDLRDEGGSLAAPGVYLARLRAGAASVTRRFVIGS
jgi:hypothetical protein